MIIPNEDIEINDDLFEYSVSCFTILSKSQVLFQAQFDDSGDEKTQENKFCTVVGQTISNEISISDTILNAIFEYYINKILPKKESYEATFDICLTEANSVEDILPMVSLNCIFVSLNSSFEIGFCFSCKWDPEHGMGIRILDGVVQKIGGADVAFC